jgi:hypothetical protein
VPDVICAGFKYGGDVEVGRPDILHQLVALHESIGEDDILLDPQLPGQLLQSLAITLALLSKQVRVGGAKNDIHQVGELTKHPR